MRVRVSAVFERGNELLCMKYIYGGKEVYALPGGGVDKDIPLREAIVTEWREELGVKLDVGDIILIRRGTRHQKAPPDPAHRHPLPGHCLGPGGQASQDPPLSRCGKTALRISDRWSWAIPRVHRELHGKGFLVIPEFLRDLQSGNVIKGNCNRALWVARTGRLPSKV
jgi:8-oxo-dGTP pyrophosphatase MutT (NUDIX family)